MSQLQEYFEGNTGNAIDKWLHYFDIYDFWFKKYRDKPIVILEIGVFQGGSLNMWRNYFGKKAKIFAIDINPLCKQFETKNTQIFIGSQEDREFLRSVKSQIPKIDILIDDGGHTMNQQITTFEEMYDHINYDGLYLCEDLHTSYWDLYGGGFKKKGSFIEYSKELIDQLNAWHIKDQRLKVNHFTKSTYSLHYYDSILLIEKKQMKWPTSKVTGKTVIPLHSFPSPKQEPEYNKKNYSKLLSFFKKKIICTLNQIRRN
jgi:hypothetical protein